jgi:hypothetical protein
VGGIGGGDGRKVRLEEVMAVIFLDKFPSFYQKYFSWIFLIDKIQKKSNLLKFVTIAYIMNG